jgi:hypothetical protein
MDVRVVELEPMRLGCLRFTGPPIRGDRPPDGLVDHWRRFHGWRTGMASAIDDVICIAYVPPVAYGGTSVVDLGVPVMNGTALRSDAEERVLGGTFVLARGTPGDLPVLLRAARVGATERGLAFERGWIEIYRPGDGAGPVLEAGVRIHD